MTGAQLAGSQEIKQGQSESNSELPLISAMISFLRGAPIAVSLTSVLILIPCYWHKYIETCDLPSHTYNAWLASLIEQGKAPGLRIVQQWQNILFDYVLSALSGLFGYAAGEKIAASLCVLIFFWGAFALVSAATKRAAWCVAPVLAMLTYGWLFHMGFMNCYLSIGLACISLALIWRGTRAEVLIGAAIAALVFLAHILGFALLVCFSIYVLVSRRLRVPAQIALAAFSLVLYFAGRYFIVHHFRLMTREWPVYWMGGADQFILYRPVYLWISVAVILLFLIQLLVSITQHELKRLVTEMPIIILLYVVAAVALYFSPGGIWPDHSPVGMPFLPDRTSLFVAILGCCVLAGLRPSRYVVGVLACVAICQFVLIYRDTGAINNVERSMHSAVRSLPAGQRLFGSFRLDNSRVQIDHLIDRACIGYCFSYGNYEPATGQFRIRVKDGNSIVIPSARDSRQMQSGEYVVQASDPSPLFQVYSCGPEQDGVCIRKLSVGRVGSAGLRTTSLDAK